MSTSPNKYDALESLIYNEGIFIQAIDIHKELDLMLVILNTKAVLRQKLSNFPTLEKATENQILNYEIVGKGTGVHWLDLDEDLSLKGFLREELKSILFSKRDPLAA
jgi:hypothetical protein